MSKCFPTSSSQVQVSHQPITITHDSNSSAEESTEAGLPIYDNVLHEKPLEDSMYEKYHALEKLLHNPDERSKTRLEASVKYIETHLEKLVSHAKSKNDKELYIHPTAISSLDEESLPFHIEISITPEGRPLIFLLPKDHFLGQGSFKRVRAAIDYLKGVKVACATVKVEDPDELKIITREYQIQKIFDEAITILLYFRGYSSKVKIMMKYANVGAISQFITPKGHVNFVRLFSPDLQQKILDKLLAFMFRMHQAGWINGDIKPHNILLHYDHEKEAIDIFITDFGVSYKKDDKKTSRFQGTPFYMGPEFLKNANQPDHKKISQKVDIYALGKTLWELFIGGDPPWCIGVPRLAYWPKPEEYEKSWKNYYKSSLKKTPKGSLERLIYKMMAPDPRQRPSMEEIVKMKPKIKIGSPTYKGMRLLTNKESLARFQNVQIAWKKNLLGKLPLEECYTFLRNKKSRKGKTFYIQTIEKGKIRQLNRYKVKPLKDGRITVAGEKKVYKTIEHFIMEKGLKHCLNFYK